MKQSTYSARKIFEILKAAKSSVSVPELCRQHGMGTTTFDNWRAKYGGMTASDMTR